MTNIHSPSRSVCASVYSCRRTRFRPLVVNAQMNAALRFFSQNGPNKSIAATSARFRLPIERATRNRGRESASASPASLSSRPSRKPITSVRSTAASGIRVIRNGDNFARNTNLEVLGCASVSERAVVSSSGRGVEPRYSALLVVSTRQRGRIWLSLLWKPVYHQ